MIVAIAIVLMIFVDQIIKYWAFTELSQVGTIPVIENVFHLTYIENYGAAFSILQNQRWIFLLITPVIISLILFSLYKGMIRNICGKAAVYLIIAGATGNLIDRIWHGFVVDFLDFRLIQFPVFNIADIYVVCGVILFFYYYLVQHDKAVASDG